MRRSTRHLFLALAAASTTLLAGCASRISNDQILRIMQIRASQQSTEASIREMQWRLQQESAELSARRAEHEQCEKRAELVKSKLSQWPNVWPN